MRENEWCDDAQKGDAFDNLAGAQNGCFEDGRCSMFYDFKSENTTFYACNFRTKTMSSVNRAPITSQSPLRSRLYVKCEKSVYYF